MSAFVVRAAEEPDWLLARLQTLVRPEFSVEVYRPNPADPVLAGPPCAVVGCERPARSVGLCTAHHTRWVYRGRPEVEDFIHSAAPIRVGRPRVDEIFDLSPLALRCRLELAWVLQCRHDERGRGPVAPGRSAGRGASGAVQGCFLAGPAAR